MTTTRPRLPGARIRASLRLLWVFVATQVRCLVFAILIFAAMSVTEVVDVGIGRYDALLIAGLAITAVLWWTGYETGREVAVIFAFHLLGLGLEALQGQSGVVDVSRCRGHDDRGRSAVLGLYVRRRGLVPVPGLAAL
ncbi:DUF817 family protein [Demequina litorisediminis]|uniref:DUF817 family protein n=1 Tax=Demequina litorisediminis TaxID=1849022 RepID=UPI0024E154E5|nr:DUF817 family protein [Demequina litorisediminis]